MSDLAKRLRELEAQATGEPWAVTVDDGLIYIDEIGRVLHDPEWADVEEWDRDLANAEIIVFLRNNALRFAQAIEDAERLERENAELRKAVQSRHDYGPASPGEQELAWSDYCATTGWDKDSHPSAKNAFCEGFCLGDAYSEGEESRAVLRADLAALRKLGGEKVNFES